MYFSPILRKLKKKLRRYRKYKIFPCQNSIYAFSDEKSKNRICQYVFFLTACIKPTLQFDYFRSVSDLEALVVEF